MSKAKTKVSAAQRRLAIYAAIVAVPLLVVAGLAIYNSQQPTGPQTIRVAYTPDANGNVKITKLGISAHISPELSRQGLIGVYREVKGVKSPANTIKFTTKQLAQNNKACDGVDGWIGTMTRYEGSSADLKGHVHAHGSMPFDFPGFHILYQTVTDSCVAKTPNYSSDDTTLELQAANGLWNAISTAKPLK